MKLNRAAFEHAQSLIRAGKVDKESDWSDVQPTLDDVNETLANLDRDDFRKWFLGLKQAGDYGFPYGDFDVVHRSALIDAVQHASQHNYADIQAAADQLIKQIDSEADIVEEASDASFPASDPPGWRERR